MWLFLLYAGFTLCGLFAIVSLPPLPNFFFFNTCCCTRLYFSWTTVILCDSILYPFGSPGPSGIHRSLCVPRILSTPCDHFRHHIWQCVCFWADSDIRQKFFKARTWSLSLFCPLLWHTPGTERMVTVYGTVVWMALGMVVTKSAFCSSFVVA